jgi:RNAse (barnase) inhibitor barstar
MKTVNLDASEWCTATDFYEPLLAGLSAPEWHGRNVNALIDSMIYGDINRIEQPFRIEVQGLQNAQPSAHRAFREAMEALAEEGAICRINTFGKASIEIAWPLGNGSFEEI